MFMGFFIFFLIKLLQKRAYTVKIMNMIYVWEMKEMPEVATVPPRGNWRTAHRAGY
jgi:hypothetical protein